MGAYTYFTFLTEDMLIIPNLLQCTLEIVSIVVDDGRDDDVPRLLTLCTLGLPPLAKQASIVRLGCRAEPNPTGSGPFLTPPPPSRPFRDKATDAIVLFNLLIEDSEPIMRHVFPEMHPFTFIVHRRALIAQIPRAAAAADDASTLVLPWSAWGVPVTRWFDSDAASIRWITTTAGQRVVTMEDRKPTPIIVRDFNPHAVSAALAREAAARGRSRGCDHGTRLPNGNRQVVKVAEDVIRAGAVFMEDVRSALPYIETVTQKTYKYEGLLIDEERILGLEVRSVLFILFALVPIRTPCGVMHFVFADQQ